MSNTMRAIAHRLMDEGYAVNEIASLMGRPLHRMGVLLRDLPKRDIVDSEEPYAPDEGCDEAPKCILCPLSVCKFESGGDEDQR